MKGRKQIYFLTFALLSSLSLFFYACVDDKMDLKNVNNVDDAARRQEIYEARAFFENHVGNIPLSANPQGMYPGNFATDWDNATYIVNTADSIISLNACIIPEYYYEGDFAKDYTKTPETEDDWYHTAVSQKIVSLKDMSTGARCCYIITLIPDASCATQSRAKIDWLFNNGDNIGNQEFSGLVIYSTLESNAIVVVNRYHEGQIFAQASLFEGNSYADMLALLGTYAINQYKPLRTKQTIENLDGNPNNGPTGSNIGGSIGGGNTSGIGGGNTGGNTGGSTSGGGGSGYSDPYGGASQTYIYDSSGNCVTCGTNHLNGYTDSGSNGGGSGGGSSSDNSGSIFPPERVKPPNVPIIEVPPTPENIAPNATKIFKGTSTLTIAQWIKVEAMIVKIRKDCMGSELFNVLEAITKTDKIFLEYYPFETVPWPVMELDTYPDGSLRIRFELVNLDDDSKFFHEMFHVYQVYTNGKTAAAITGFGNARGNYEVEAKIAEASYMERDKKRLTSAAWDAKYLNDKYLKDNFLQDAIELTKYINSKGNLKDPASEASFNSDFYKLAKAIRDQDNSYKVIETRTINTNLSVLKILSTKC